eukprot:gene4135-940_t
MFVDFNALCNNRPWPIFGAASVPFATWVLAQPKGLRKSMMLAAWLQLDLGFQAKALYGDETAEGYSYDQLLAD